MTAAQGHQAEAETLHQSAPHPYRRDIDGLRALAVLPIVLGHAGVRGFGGGFVGVDVFFVISGYLITGILLRDLTQKRHSIVEFYRRRVLRILPALAAVLVASTAFALVAMLPGELVRYARSLAATGLFASNVLFYAESGYFDVASHTKPLLHCWSLAVEEQFYILWPLLLAAIGAGRRGVLTGAIVAVVVVSFVLSLWLVARDMSAAFYLLPTRAWELGLGGLVALAPAWTSMRLVREAAAAVAVAALGYAIWRFNSVMAFPGAAALVPCLAAATLIAAGPGTLAARVLALPPLVFVGLISYSLYLWHWPVIVFGEIWLLLPSTPAAIAGELAAAFALATLSWRFVEQPFRVGGRRWPNRRVLIGGSAFIAASIAVAAAIIATRGFPQRFTPEQAAIAAFADRDYQTTYRPHRCFLTDVYDELDPACLAPAEGKPAILLIGDSQAAHLWPGLSHYRDRFAIQQATVVGCRPGLYEPSSRKKCERFYRDMLTRWAPAHRPSLVLLAGRWQAMDYPTLEPLLAQLARDRITTVLVGPLPDYGAVLPRLLVLADRTGDASLPDRARNREVDTVDRRLWEMAARHGVRYISMLDTLCPHGRCRYFAAPQVPLQFDYGHLTPQGSRVVADELMRAIARPVSAP